MILIVGFETDGHVQEVRDILGQDAVLFDTASYPATVAANINFSRARERRCLTPRGQPTIDLSTVGAVWYRRIGPLTLHDVVQDPVARAFAWSESNEALQGLWASLDCFWMNSAIAEETSGRKVRQLRAARKLGISIPDTLITNDPEEAREFILSHPPGDVIRKAFRIIPEAPRETRKVWEHDLDHLPGVAFAPVTFQRYVPLDFDVRVTIVGDELFAAAIRSSADYEADYRPGLATASVTEYALPDEVATQLMSLMAELGLVYGAVDLRVTPEGEHVFFEVNTAGEYRFISQRIHQPISAAIAAHLRTKDADWQRTHRHSGDG